MEDDKIKRYVQSFIHQYRQRYKLVDEQGNPIPDKTSTPKKNRKQSSTKTNQAEKPMTEQEIADRQNKIELDANRPFLEQIEERAVAGDADCDLLLKKLYENPKLMSFLLTGI